ncbi:MAG: YggS family pyridoxal phosphate-dependent enzyme [Dehalococcoidia bacterium]
MTPAETSQPLAAERVAAVRNRIALAAERSGRAPDAVTLIAVSKTWPAAAVRDVLAAGVADFGENRVQEGVAKAEELDGEAIRWHLIGHLQTNKARAALGTFAILHAVDSERLLRAIAAAASAPARIMIEVNVAEEPSKFGVTPPEVASLLKVAAALPQIDVRGLMTVAPHVDDAELVRPVFRGLRELAEANGLRELSMGMTNDYEVAIEEGATFVRVGRAIFGERA